MSPTLCHPLTLPPSHSTNTHLTTNKSTNCQGRWPSQSLPFVFAGPLEETPFQFCQNITTLTSTLGNPACAKGTTMASNVRAITKAYEVGLGSGARCVWLCACGVCACVPVCLCVCMLGQPVCQSSAIAIAGAGLCWCLCCLCIPNGAALCGSVHTRSNCWHVLAV